MVALRANDFIQKAEVSVYFMSPLGINDCIRNQRIPVSKYYGYEPYALPLRHAPSEV